VEAGESGLLLIVPEQYSHDAERQLCAECGDGLSLFGETMSFTRLCGRVFSETGAPPGFTLDGGGQMLVMHSALESVAPRLRVFGARGQRTELIERLLDAAAEFKSLCISPDTLESMSKRVSNPLADKLYDLALIFGSYEANLRAHGHDASDRLALLADSIGESSVGDKGHIYFDGFNDFTAQEMCVIERLLQKKADMTVCLTCDLTDDSEVFQLPLKTATRLRRLADEHGVGVKTLTMETQSGEKAAEFVYLEKHLFGGDAVVYPGENNAITIYPAATRYSECECAAYKVWQLVRDGYRWRDIGVMARDWEQYGSICENVFEKYGIPFFSSGRTDIMNKPPVALIDAALEIAASGWEYKPVFRYLKTGLTDIGTDSCSELENYVIKWNIRGAVWARSWTLPPSGYGGEADETTLARLNDLRTRVTAPLLRLRDGIKGVSQTGEKLRALYAFLEDIGLAEALSEKSEVFSERFDTRLADEYAQLWDVIKNAIEQMFTMAGETQLSAVEFRKLFTMMLSRYDVGVIPVSLDRTVLGGMAMSRRRDFKCLILLGATDDNLPRITRGNGALSDSERAELVGLGADMPAGPEERLCREMNMLYSTLTLPSRQLVLTYPGGAGERPSFIIKRLKNIFGIIETALREEEYMASAQAPCFELAAYAGHTNESPLAAAAREYFFGISGETRERLISSDTLLHAGRGSLSGGTARRLYGRELTLSATRVDRYYSCPYLHFLQNGLRLFPRVPAGFDAPAAGIFMHYVLEAVSREIMATVGFKNADAELCRDLTIRHIESYIHDVLLDFEGANARFVYLFRRLERDVIRVVLDMRDELKRSDFLPLDFELEFSELSGGQEKSRDLLNLSGIVDRVDGWKHDGKLYLRVIDYKSRKKAFSLSDVVHGRNMQMLIYLFALQKYGGARYGEEIRPAGVLYVPATDIILKAPRNSTDEELSKMRERELRRDGLILEDPAVIEAMENGDNKKYLPVKTGKDGVVSGDSLVDAGQVAKVSKHVDFMLRRAVGEILGGGIECKPYFKNDNDNACRYCEYLSVCGFDESLGDRRVFAGKRSAEEVWQALNG